jgi:hypothetical protein
MARASSLATLSDALISYELKTTNTLIRIAEKGDAFQSAFSQKLSVAEGIKSILPGKFSHGSISAIHHATEDARFSALPALTSLAA